MIKYYFIAFEVSLRTSNCLRSGYINTLKELLDCSKEDLYRIKNLGIKTLNEIEEKLKSIGLHLRKEKCPFCKGENTDMKYTFRPIYSSYGREKPYGTWECLDCMKQFKLKRDKK